MAFAWNSSVAFGPEGGFEAAPPETGPGKATSRPSLSLASHADPIPETGPLSCPYNVSVPLIFCCSSVLFYALVEFRKSIHGNWQIGTSQGV